MKLYQRISFFLLIILFLFLTFLVGINGFGWLPEDYLPILVNTTYNSLEVGLISFILFFIGIWLFQSLLGQRSIKETIVQENEVGVIRISLSAIEDLVEQLVLQQSGIKEVKIRFSFPDEALNIFLKLAVDPEDAEIPTLSVKLQNLLTDYLRETVGLYVGDVLVLVDEVETPKKRESATVRVR